MIYLSVLWLLCMILLSYAFNPIYDPARYSSWPSQRNDFRSSLSLILNDQKSVAEADSLLKRIVDGISDPSKKAEAEKEIANIPKTIVAASLLRSVVDPNSDKTNNEMMEKMKEIHSVVMALSHNSSELSTYIKNLSSYFSTQNNLLKKQTEELKELKQAIFKLQDKMTNNEAVPTIHTPIAASGPQPRILSPVPMRRADYQYPSQPHSGVGVHFNSGPTSSIVNGQGEVHSSGFSYSQLVGGNGGGYSPMNPQGREEAVNQAVRAIQNYQASPSGYYP